MAFKFCFVEFIAKLTTSSFFSWFVMSKIFENSMYFDCLSASEVLILKMFSFSA